MAQSKKVHIRQSYFRRLRNWFSRRAHQARRLFCGAYVEPEIRCDSDASVVEGPVAVVIPVSEADVAEVKEAVVAEVTKEADVEVTEAAIEAAEATESINKPRNPQSAIKTVFGIQGEKHELRGCTCGGFGEHPVTKTSSAHTALESEDVSPKASRSAPLLAGTSDGFSGLPDCRTSLLGSFHQANIPAMWNPSCYSGTQCTTTSFAAIVCSAALPVGLWSSETIDRTVHLGDRLHRYLIHQMAASLPGSHYLAADEMPKIPKDATDTWPVECTRCQEFQGLLYPNPLDTESMRNQLTWQMLPGMPCRELGDALEGSFEEKAQGCVITFNSQSSSIFKNPVGGYIVFDSHGKNILGFPDFRGSASLLRFASLNELEEYFRNMVTCQTMYSLTGFRVELRH